MKKFLKIFTVILAAVISLTILSSCKNNKAEITADNVPLFYSEWMKYINGDIPVKNIAIPGSHDAGTYNMLSLGETQSSSILTQLKFGVRYFDIRVEEKGDSLVIFHSVLSGMDFNEVINDISEFMETNDSEVLILDFQHFKNDSMQKVIDTLESSLDTERYAVKNDTEMSDADFIDNLKLEDCRGKFIITWGSDYKIDEKNYLFRRNNDEGSLSECSLESYYEGDLHKKSSEEFIENALPLYFEKFSLKNKGLFVLQGQLTAPTLVTTPLSLEESHALNMNNYVRNLKNSDLLKYVNIIMRDYVTDDIEKTDSVLSLNIAKNIVSDTKEFLKYIEI